MGLDEVGCMKTIPVSVVIPVLNEVGTITSTLQKMSQQTVTPNELIFIDAGSSDGDFECAEGRMGKAKVCWLRASN